MGLLERTFIVTDDRYDAGCGLQEFKGTYSLCAAKKGESKTFLKWVYPQKYDQDTKENFPGDKAFPMGIALADSKEETVAVLQGWIDELEGGDGNLKRQSEVNKRKPDLEKDDIPF